MRVSPSGMLPPTSASCGHLTGTKGCPCLSLAEVLLAAAGRPTDGVFPFGCLFLPFFFKENTPPKAGKATRGWDPPAAPPSAQLRGSRGDVTAVPPGPTGRSPSPAPHCVGVGERSHPHSSGIFWPGAAGRSDTSWMPPLPPPHTNCPQRPRLPPKGQPPHAAQTPALGQHPAQRSPAPESGVLALQGDGGLLGLGDEQEGTALRPQRVTVHIPW